MDNNFLISVIVSTYNRPDALEVVMRALCNQDDEKYEIIVADDGSGDSTRNIIQKIKTQTCTPIRHVWQPDRGFRLAAIRNLAVKSARGLYLVFLDGDCIPPPNWVSCHRALAEKGWMVVGQRILTSESFSQKILQGMELDWNCKYFYHQFLNGNVNRVWPSLRLKLGYLRKICPKKWEKVRGCNWGMWFSDYVDVNGSDETFEYWGSEDTDLAVRLLNYGVNIKLGVNFLYVLHLWHKDNLLGDNVRKHNIVLQRSEQGIIFPTKGLS